MYEIAGGMKGVVDLEAGEGGLYPGIGYGENELRWGFIRKVYGILTAQILLTTIISSFTVLYAPLNDTLTDSPGLLFALAILPFVLLCPLYLYRERHPLNFVFLGLFTVCLSLTIGVACANTEGKDFSYLGPVLFAGLIVLLTTSFIQMFFPLGPTSVAIFGGLGAILFAAYLVYDTDNLIKRHSYDDYIWASVVLYLDILNLFLSLLNMLKGMQSDG
ncbi:BI1-like protein [Acorus calamus]|uniref:BI1-like protein n=1 Tax=Acorus calamus TaxID=4465 RepID=A0AAV9F0A7_ACOCL|nr:BI1-like protein [Acorus calamus]